jgi:hypothetical protein
MGKMVWVGPPWCEFVDEDEAYLRGQVGQVGSGLLSGADLPEHVVAEVEDEVRRIVGRRARELGRVSPPVASGRELPARAA